MGTGLYRPSCVHMCIWEQLYTCAYALHYTMYRCCAYGNTYIHAHMLCSTWCAAVARVYTCAYGNTFVYTHSCICLCEGESRNKGPRLKSPKSFSFCLDKVAAGRGHHCLCNSECKLNHFLARNVLNMSLLILSHLFRSERDLLGR